MSFKAIPFATLPATRWALTGCQPLCWCLFKPAKKATRMHTLTTARGTTFHYNSDLSGDVIIVSPGYMDTTVPAICLLEFVADYVRGEKIAALEQATTRQILLPTQG